MQRLMVAVALIGMSAPALAWNPHDELYAKYAEQQAKSKKPAESSVIRRQIGNPVMRSSIDLMKDASTMSSYGRRLLYATTACIGLSGGYAWLKGGVVNTKEVAVMVAPWAVLGFTGRHWDTYYSTILAQMVQRKATKEKVGKGTSFGDECIAYGHTKNLTISASAHNAAQLPKYTSAMGSVFTSSPTTMYQSLDPLNPRH